MKTDFLGGFYATRSLPLSAQTCVNLYLEINESQNGQDGVLLGTPGLIAKAQLNVGMVRGLRTVLGALYAVCGPSVYRVDGNFAVTKLGTLPNAVGPVSITDNGVQVLFSHKDGWHYSTFGTNTFAAVADPDQPKDAIVTCQDGYVLFTDTDDRFGITALNDVTSIDPLDIATAEGVPDGLISIVSDHREAWLLCNTSTEIWGDTGNALFPFERIPGGMLETGCGARFSIARADDSIFWLTQDRVGNANIIRTNAYKPIRISTHALEHELEAIRVDDAVGFAYQQEGHTFYQITFPTADQTWVYDCATKLWHRRGWTDTQGVLHRHRANCYAFFNDQHVVGDWQNGKLYVMDLSTYTDAGAAIYRERAWPIPDAERKRIRLDRVELLAEMGDGIQISPDVTERVTLQVSHDGGRSFGYKRYQQLGQLGKRLVRAVWRRLGMGRGSVLKVSTTTAGKVAWLGVNVDGEILG